MTKSDQIDKRHMAQKPAKILAIETSTSACSVALRCDGELKTFTEVGTNVHSQEVLPQIEKLLRQVNWKVQELDAVAVGQGPGSFTGLRIGVGVAQGISYGARCPMIGVSSLAALAIAADVHHGLVSAAIDARMSELYFAQYNVHAGELERIGEEVVCAPQELRCADIGILIGNAWQQYWHSFKPEMIQNIECPSPSFPNAREVLMLAEGDYTAQKFTDAKSFAPVYVRNNVAKKTADR